MNDWNASHARLPIESQKIRIAKRTSIKSHQLPQAGEWYQTTFEWFHPGVKLCTFKTLEWIITAMHTYHTYNT